MSAPFELLQRLGVHGPFDRVLGRRPGVSGTAAYGLIDQLRGRPTGAAIETLGSAARAVRRAEHPGLQRVIGAGRVDGSAYVMTELVAGESLALLVTRGRSAGWPTVPAHVAADLVAEVASITGALHQVGHTHGRLDPENVLISYRGTVRLMNTVSAAVEARLEGDKLTPADDIHALGELFEFLLRGGGLSLGAVDMGPYEPVIAQALALDPAQRPADGAAFARALRQAGSPSSSTATLTGWVRDCCPDRAGVWRDILKTLRGEPTPRTFKRLARLLAPAQTDAPASAQAPSFAPPVIKPVTRPPRVSTGPLLVPPRVLKPLPDPGEDEPTTEVRSPSALEIRAIKPAIDLQLTTPDPTPPDPATDSHEATSVFAAPKASPPPEGESTSEALFPIAAVTPAPIFNALTAGDVPPDGYEPELYVDAPPPAAPVIPSLDPLLDPTAGRPTGNLHSAWVVELSRIINGVCVESRVVHAGQRHPWIRNARDRVLLRPPKGATGHWRHLGEQHPLTAQPTALEPGDRAELHHQGARWTIRVDHAASAPGGATGRRKPWGLWLTAIAAGLGLHIIFAAGVISLDAIGVQLTVDEPEQKERWASLAEDKPLPDAPKPKPKPKARPKPKPKPVASKPLPPADPAEARPTMPNKVRERVRNRMNTARRRAKDDAEALLNAVAANPDAPGRDGATLKDVVSTMDAVGSAGKTAALEVGGTLGALPGGDINIGREQARLSPGGGKQIGRDIGRIGKRRSKGNGKVRGKVRNLSSRTKVAQCSVSKSAVRAAIERKQGRIVGCYESALLRKDTLSGKVTIEWRLGTSGRPTGAKVKVSTLGDPKVAQCVLGVIRKTKFPAPKTGECLISYPFIFSPSR
jgi:outer membrane biosynthesis protein TonB/serine/threonine protein kinase